jgi:hypothetical protein
MHEDGSAFAMEG